MVEDPELRVFDHCKVLAESIDICFRNFKWRNEISWTKASALCGVAHALSANSSCGAFLATIHTQSVRQQRAAEMSSLVN